MIIKSYATMGLIYNLDKGFAKLLPDSLIANAKDRNKNAAMVMGADYNTTMQAISRYFKEVLVFCGCKHVKSERVPDIVTTVNEAQVLEDLKKND